MGWLWGCSGFNVWVRGFQWGYFGLALDCLGFKVWVWGPCSRSLGSFRAWSLRLGGPVLGIVGISMARPAVLP